MAVKALPARSELDKSRTWSVETLYPDDAAWQAAGERVLSLLPDIEEFRGRLADGPAQVADFLKAYEDLEREVRRYGAWAMLNASVDAADQAAQSRTERARALSARAGATLAFAEPELLAIGVDTLKAWAASEPRLAIYAHHFDRLGRRAAHVREEAVEEVLSLASEPLQAMGAAHSVLANAELEFAPARDAAGEEYEVAQGTYGDLLGNRDRDVRRTAWRSYADGHLRAQRTMAALLAGGIRRDVFVARARRYRDSLDAALSPNFIPAEAFHGVLSAFRENLPTWHRYWRLRRRALGLDRQYVYDTRAALDERVAVPYEQAVDWISEGLAPLGDEYVSTLRRGALDERWVDVYPNRGKRMGAYSMGVPDSHPFIFMSYNDNLLSLSTLAHELGHSMHSWYTMREQPYVYANYGLFAAECASNFHQAMVRAHLLASNPDRRFQVGVIEEAMSNFHRYFLVMPTLARFELEVHQRAEANQPLSADWMTRRMYELLDEAYGGEVDYEEEEDRARSGITWAQFHTHLYSNFYVYQYATGIAGAHWMADRVLKGEPGAAEDYLKFISAGSSLYPLDALRAGGVDMTSREPVDRAFAVMASYVDRLEQLLL